MLNRITMTGRLVADPELRRTQSGFRKWDTAKTPRIRQNS